MDLEYLLFLQGLREGALAFLEPIMHAVTKFATSPELLCLIALLYWVVDKRIGAFTVLTRAGSVAVNAFVKLTACAYRPWIRDVRILPAGDAKTAATGYSFPSGHTVSVSGYACGLICGYRRKRKWLAAILCIWVLVTGFSRNYLGVHTPQDVAVAIAETVLVAFLLTCIKNYLEKKPERDVLVAGIAVVFIVLGLFYVSLKPYPMDYTQEGKLLVDPKVMIYDGFVECGFALGAILGWLVEHRFIHFKNEPKRVVSYCLAAVGFVPVIMMSRCLLSVLAGIMNMNVACFITFFTQSFFVMAIMPFFYKLVNKKN